MKGKRFLSVACAAAMLMSFAAAPIGQAQAYEIAALPSADTPVMPDAIKNREPRNYLIEETPETYGDFLDAHVLIMPGDTFEYVVFDSKEDKTVWTVSDEYMSVEGDTQTEGFEIEGSVDLIGTTTRTYKEGSESVTKTWNTKWKNNTNCPLIITSVASGSGPLGIPNWGYNGNSISVQLFKPYYSITYRYNDYGTGTYWGEPENLFWAAGEYSDLTFPSEYWITDVPYTITVPKPTMEREHFEKFSQYGFEAEGKVEDKGAYIDYTICWDPVNNNCDFCSYGDQELCVYQTGGSTVTFNGNGGKVKGRDKWVLEVDDLEGESTDYGYDLDDFAPTREGDEFLGWCTKESALYGSFLTKDSEADVYELYGGSGIYGKSIQLYAKWKSETDELLEKNGWEIYDDGTLGLLNLEGMNAWREACENDPTLAPKVRAVRTGYKDEDVIVFSHQTFKDCVNLEEFVMKEGQQLNGGNIFEGCTNLKKVYVNYNTETQGSIHYALSEETFKGAGKDLVVYVPEKDIDMYNQMFPTISYLFNADEEDVRYPLTVNGQVVTQKNLTIPCGEGTATFDPETSTLTLDNADMTDSLFAHFMKTHYIDEEDNWFGYQASAIISDLPELNIVLKGKNVVHTSNGDLPYFLTSYQNVNITGDGSIEASFYSENYLVEDPETGESVPKPASTGALYTTVDGNLSLDGISADRLFAEPKGELTIKNCTFNGGVFSGNGDLTIENTSMQYFKGDAAGFSIPEDTTVTMNGKILTIDGCTFDNVGVNAGETAEALRIKDSTIRFDGAVSAAESTKLEINNSTITGWAQDGGFTNVAEDNIILTECEVTQGTLKGDGYFEILPESEINKDPEIFYSVYLDDDTWTKGSGKDYTVKIVRDPSDKDIASKLEELVIDEETIKNDFYSISNIDEMSVSFVIDSAFLETLTPGKHEIIPVFKDGRCSYAVIVKDGGAQDTDIEPDTDTDSEISSDTNSDTDSEISSDTNSDTDSEPTNPNKGTIKFDAGAWNSDRIAFYIWDETEKDVKFATKNGWVDEDPDEKYDLIEGTKLEDGTFESFEFEIPDDHIIYAVFFDPDNEKQTYDCIITKDALGDTAELTGESIVWNPANGFAFDEVKFRNSGLTTRLYFDWNGNVIGKQLHPNANGAFEVAILVYGFSNHLDENGNSVVTFDKVQTAMKAFGADADDVMARYLTFEGYDDRYNEEFARSVIYPSADNAGVYGDIDADGQITANDALAVLRSSVGMDTLDEQHSALADIDEDGQVTANDALAVLRSSVGMGDSGKIGQKAA